MARLPPRLPALAWSTLATSAGTRKNRNEDRLTSAYAVEVSDHDPAFVLRCHPHPPNPFLRLDHHKQSGPQHTNKEQGIETASEADTSRIYKAREETHRNVALCGLLTNLWNQAS